jgi:hypothetical protein
MIIQKNPSIQAIISDDGKFSKNFTTSADIAASGVSTERFISEDDEWSSAPFDTMLISNSDVVDLGIRLDWNPDNVIPVPAASTIGVTKAKFRNFSIENQDAATAHTAGKVKILVQNTKFRRRE